MRLPRTARGQQRLLRWSLAAAVPLCLAFPAIGWLVAAQAAPNVWLARSLILVTGIARAVVGLNVFTRYVPCPPGEGSGEASLAAWISSGRGHGRH